MKLLESFNVTSKDKYNFRTAESLNTAAGKGVLNVFCAAIGEDVDKDNNPVNTCYLGTTDGYFNSISNTARDNISDLIDYMTDIAGDNGTEDVIVPVLIKSKKGNNGREYLMIELA